MVYRALLCSQVGAGVVGDSQVKVLWWVTLSAAPGVPPPDLGGQRLSFLKALGALSTFS